MGDMVQAMAHRWTDKAEGIVRDLRGIADRVEREVTNTPNTVGSAEYGWRTQRIIHEITWGVANLNLDNLAHDANEVDVWTIREPLERRDAARERAFPGMITELVVRDGEGKIVGAYRDGEWTDARD